MSSGKTIPTVLLVDYDPRSITLLRGLLTRMPARTLLARDGRAAIEEFLRSGPDLTLIQDLLPKLHGFETCRRIKDTDAGRSRPVILLTSQRNHGVLIATGCDAYLEKPFREETLVGLLHHFLSAKGGPIPGRVPER